MHDPAQPTSGPIVVRVLGTVRAQDAIPSSRGQELLATLAAAGEHPVSGERLAELCWGRIDATSTGRVRTAISRLRHHLPDGAIVHEFSGYRLALSMEQVDAWWFESLVHGHGSARDRPEPLAEAFSLWPSEFARWAGPSNELIDAWRAQLTADYESLIVRLASTSDAPTGVTPVVLTMLDEHPDRGDFAAAAAMALHRAHRQAEAVTVLARHRAALAARGLVATTEIAAVEQQVLSDDAMMETTPATSRSAVPGTATALIGRETELVAIEKMAVDSRHVSLVGLGGVGKTRLAIELAHRWSEVGYDIRFVASAGSSSEPTTTVAHDLGFHVATTNAEETLSTQLRRSELILILDACEGAAHEIARMVEVLLRNCPRVRIVTTSRRPLGNDAEVLFHVDPMTAEDAVELLRARLPKRRSTSGTDEWLVEVTRRLDHLPLAIELAATRLGSTSVDAFLEQPSEHATAQHAEHVVDRVLLRSVELVSVSAQRHIDALAVMVGPFDEQLLAAVASCTVDEARNTLRELVECSIVDTLPLGHGATYRALDTVQRFALRRAQRSGSLAGYRQAHARRVSEVASTAHRNEFAAGAAEADATLRSMMPHLRSAFGWSLDASPELALQLIRALHEWSINHLVYDVSPWAEQALVMHRGALDDETRAEMAGLAASACWFRGDERAAASFVDEALGASDLAGVPVTVHTANTRLALAYADAAAPDQLVLDVLAAASRHPDPFWSINASVVMAIGATTMGLGDAAQHFARSAAAGADTSDSPSVHAWVSYAMGVVALPRYAHQALVNLRTAEGLASSTGAGMIRWMASTASATAARLAGHPSEAARSVSAALQAWTAGAFAAQVAHCLREAALQLHAAGDIKAAREAIATADSVPLSLPSYGFDRDHLELVRADTGVRGPHPPAPLERLVRTTAVVVEALAAIHLNPHPNPNPDSHPNPNPNPNRTDMPDQNETDQGDTQEQPTDRTVGGRTVGRRRDIIVEISGGEGPSRTFGGRPHHQPQDIIPEPGTPELPTDERPPL